MYNIQLYNMQLTSYNCYTIVVIRHDTIGVLRQLYNLTYPELISLMLYMCTCKHRTWRSTHSCVATETPMYIYIYTFVKYIRISITLYIYIYIHIHVHLNYVDTCISVNKGKGDQCTAVWPPKRQSIYIHIYVYIYIYICIYIYSYICNYM